VRKTLVTIACILLGALALLCFATAPFALLWGIVTHEAQYLDTAILAAALAIGISILTVKAWKYREGEVQSIRKRPLLWAIPGAIVLAYAFVCATNALRDLFWCGLASGILRELPPENVIGFIVESSIAGIAFAVGRWLWPYRRLSSGRGADSRPREQK